MSAPKPNQEDIWSRPGMTDIKRTVEKIVDILRGTGDLPPKVEPSSPEVKDTPQGKEAHGPEGA